MPSVAGTEHAAKAAPHGPVRTVTLHSYVLLHLPVVAGLGVRLAFPRVSGDNGAPARLAVVLTDPARFEVAEPEPSGSTLVLTAASGAPPGSTADLFLTLGRYRITVVLRLKRFGPSYASDVLFRLRSKAPVAEASGTAACAPIHGSLHRRLRAVAEFDAAAPVVRRIREEDRRITASGTALVLRVRHQVTRGRYRVIRFSVVDGTGKRLVIEQVSVGSERGQGIAAVPSAWVAVTPSAAGRARGEIAVRARDLPRSRYAILAVATNLGQVTARW
ncbi:MAG: hypothetical protein ACYCQK_08015 [Acidiferrobacteraceae bacterium]